MNRTNDENTSILIIDQGLYTNMMNHMQAILMHLERLSMNGVEAAWIDPNRIYSASEAATILCMKDKKAIYYIDQDQLPRARTRGRKVCFLGRDIVNYVTFGRLVDEVR